MKKLYLIFLIFISACTSYPFEELPGLQGKTMEEIKSSYGHPSIERIEGDSKLWAYYQDHCSSLIFFDVNNVVQYAETRGSCS